MATGGTIPPIGGEVDVGAGVDGLSRGKISCMDQELKIPGLELPVDGDNGHHHH